MRIWIHFRALVDIIRGIHSAGVMHRDIKPSNVLLDPGSDEVKLCDFGLASLCTASTRKCGTPNYLAPEITGDQPYGQAVDLWSLGCVLYFMFVQEVPFLSETLQELKSKVLKLELS